MIDLHTHTTASDGSYTPAQLVDAAAALGLEALGICDHDTLAGYDEAALAARSSGVELICGIELSTRLHDPAAKRGKSVHLLGYFINEAPSPEFRGWLDFVRESRRDRNRRLIARLNELGVRISLEEVEAMGGSLTGRPHFARLLVRKGYVADIPEAFRIYLDESASAYVERVEPTVIEGIRHILEGGGMPSLAHPVRLGKKNAAEELDLIEAFCEGGLRAIEVYHSDHGPRDVERYTGIAQRYGLAITGGSDFHGDNKPSVSLGTGQGNLAIPREVLDRLRNSNGS